MGSCMIHGFRDLALVAEAEAEAAVEAEAAEAQIRRVISSRLPVGLAM